MDDYIIQFVLDPIYIKTLKDIIKSDDPKQLNIKCKSMVENELNIRIGLLYLIETISNEDDKRVNSNL